MSLNGLLIKTSILRRTKLVVKESQHILSPCNLCSGLKLNLYLSSGCRQGCQPCLAPSVLTFLFGALSTHCSSLFVVYAEIFTYLYVGS